MHSILVAGVDLGTTKTCVVIAEIHEDPFLRRDLKIVGVGQARSTGMRHIVTHIEEATESVKAAIQEAELMAGAKVDRVYVGISGEHIRATTSPGVVAVMDDDISLFDLRRVHEVARAVAHPPDRELVHAIPQDYIVDHHAGIKDPLGMVGTRLEAELYLVTCSAVAAENIRKAVQRAGYRVQELVLESLAAARSVLTEDEKEVGVAMVEVGACTTNLAAYCDGELRHVAVLPFGGATVTNDLVRGLSVPFSEAKRAKEHFGVAFAQLVDPKETVELPGPSPGQTRHVSRELIAHVVEQRLDEMFGLVHAQLESVGLLNRLGAGIVLTGGASTLLGTVELAQHVFAAPVRNGSPGEGLSGLSDSVERPKFATAVGLALYGADRYEETGDGASTLTSGLVSKVGSWLKEFF
jgi:cell division protein FtsA